MSSSPAHLVQTLLANPLDLKNVQSVTAEDVTYVSLSEDNPELRRLLPWAGTNKGPESIVKAVEGIGRTWESKAFEVRDVIEQADKVALFGFEDASRAKRLLHPSHSSPESREGSSSTCNSSKTASVPRAP
jgi:hypothetical protein